MLRPGHRIGLLAHNTPTQLSMHAAVNSQRFVLVPLPIDLPAQRLQEAMATVGVDGLVCDPERRSLAESVRGPRPLIVCDVRGDPQDTLPGDVGDARPDAFAHVLTSGTTQASWVTMLRHHVQAHRGAAMERLACDGESVWLDVLPPWHVGGMMLIDRCMHGGGRIDLHERFEVPKVAKALEIATHASLVPTMLKRLLDADVAPGKLDCALVGGASLNAELTQRARAAGWPIHATYGLTEACSQVTTALPEEVDAMPGTAGRPLRGVEVSIHMADDAGIGEIVVDGTTVTTPGPLHTGDLGRLEDGHLFVLGRADDRIVSGGENVSPDAVEAVLCAHPDVADAMVIGVADAEWGQRVVAAVVAEVVPADLAAWCKARLAPHERPKAFHAVHDVPRTASGKPRRAILRRDLTDALRKP